MSQKDHGQAAFFKFSVDSRLGFQPVDRGEEQSVDTAGEESADDAFLSFGCIEGVGQDEVVAELVGPFFDAVD